MKLPACIFVGGPIQHAIRADGGFHSGARSVIELAIKALEDLGHHVLSAHVHEDFGRLDVTNKFQEVCLRDYEWMLRCDMFVAILPLDSDGKMIFSAGTSVELGWASAMDKPIIIVCDPAPKYSHLINGLDVIARVTQIDINRGDLATTLCDTVRRMLERQASQKVSRSWAGPTVPV